MHKEIQRCSPKETVILSKHYLSQHDSLFSLLIAFGFKTKKQVWGNVEDSGDMSILLSTHSSAVQCRRPLLSFSLVSLSPDIVDNARSVTQYSAAVEEIYTESLGVCLHIALEPPFDPFQEQHKGSNHVFCSFEKPRTRHIYNGFECICKAFLFSLSWLGKPFVSKFHVMVF